MSKIIDWAFANPLKAIFITLVIDILIAYIVAICVLSA